jgi:ATP-dependent exoDNAse (exonuclease V) beta subunit
LRDAPQEIRDVAEIGTPSGISPRIIGEIVHRALRWWRLPGNTPDLASVLGSYAWEEGIADPQMLDQAVNEATDLLRRTEASNIAQRIEQAQKSGQVYREVPFTYQLGERTISGVIDVLFFLKQRWHVVDYKTGIVSPEDGETLWERLTEHSRRYHAQVGIYAGAVEGMTGQTPDVHLHYIRYVRTIHVQPDVWQPILAALDTDIETALTEGA